MPKRKPAKYRDYFKVLEEFGLEQLDVYRHKDRDVLRLRDQKGRIILVELPGLREDLSIDELRKIIERSLSGTR